MLFNKSILLLAIVCLWRTALADDSDALRECGNMHKLEWKSIPTAAASFSNSNCWLKCSIGEKILSNDAINEGFVCPRNPNGLCHQGQCVQTNVNSDLDALRECTNLHHVDFKNGNHTGTAYSNSKCTLKCVVAGQAISSNSMNEGYACPSDSKGICRKGQCVTSGVPATPAPTTKAPSNGHFALSDVAEFDIKIVSGNFFQAQPPVYVSVCLQDKKENFNEFHRGLCKQIYMTEANATRSRDPAWNRIIKIKGPFTRESFLLVNLWNKLEPIHNIGQWSQTIDYIFYSFSGAALESHKDLSSYKHQQKIDMIHSSKYLGDIAVEMSFVFTK